ncbi:MAG: PIN/TRAM domain-containing protein [Planctomycetota bacterium]|nr:PIN/TRAM domain-containing protein [Planctomycetota bacterium]MDA1164674.1 PIN/TRAM domain-containing protein [Planctomycetota bacterium]
MLLLVIRILYAVICGGAIAAYLGTDQSMLPTLVQQHGLAAFFIMLMISQSVTVLDVLIRRKRIELISAIYFGLLIGVLLSFLLMLAIGPVVASLRAQAWQPILGAMSTLILSYMSISFLLQTKDDFRFVIPYVEFARELKGGRPLILDSSALIDGRISDVVETRIIDTQMIVPGFVLKEVQDIADSSDKTRRTRGRRGLDVLSKLQSIPHAEIEVRDTDDRDNVAGKGVDQKLVSLAKLIGAGIVTNDFNLNKVASVQGVDVINLNDVASALRPRYLPGDTLALKIQREGESQGQGVGYLDDGTMVVCEQAQGLIGQEIEATVTSVLQSSAGRMIFARPAGVEPSGSPGEYRARHK